MIKEENKLSKRFKSELIHFDQSEKLFLNMILKYFNDRLLFDELKERVKTIIKTTLNSRTYSLSFRKTTEENKNLVVFFMSWLAFKHYDGKLWPYIREELASLYYSDSEQKIDRVIRHLIKDENKYPGERIITNPLVHCAVPIEFIKSFFDFVYDIFEINFDYSIEGVPTLVLIKDALSGLNKILLEDVDTDELNINLDFTRKTYKLIKSTKQAILNYLDDMTEIIAMYLKLINAWYYNSSHNEIFPKVIVDKFDEWILGKQIKDKNREKKEYIANPYFKFCTKSKIIKLHLPTILLKNVEEFKAELLSIKLINGSEEASLIINDDFLVKKRIGYYSVSFSPLLIKKPLNELSLTINYNDQEIYNTSNTLFRNFIIFNNDGKELFNNSNYEGQAFLIHRENLNFQSEYKLNLKNYIISTFDIDPKKPYKIEDKIFYFARVFKEKIYGHSLKHLICFLSNKPIICFEEVDSYIFELPLEKKDLILLINDKEITLDDDNCYIDLCNGNYRYNLLLNKINLKSNYYTINIKNKNSDLLKSKSFLLDRNLKLKIVDTEKELIKNLFLDSDFNLNKIEKSRFDFGKNASAKFHFRIGFNEFNYLVLPGIPRYKHNEDERWEILKELELTSKKLYVTKDITNLKVILTENRYFLLENIEEHEDFFVYSLAPFFNFAFDFKTIKLELIDRNDYKKTIDFYLEQQLEKKAPRINYINDNLVELHFDIKCLKKEFLIIEISDRNKYQMIQKIKDKSIKVHGLKPFHKYRILIKKENNIRLGYVLEDLYEWELEIYDTSLLESKTFFIYKSAYYHAEGFFEEIYIKTTAIKFLRKINKDELSEYSNLNLNNYCYECILYKICPSNKLIPFSNVKKVFVEVGSERHSIYIILYIEDKDGDGLLLDTQKQFIFDANNPRHLSNIENIEYVTFFCDRGRIK